MGLFSYICRGCGSNLRSTTHKGEHVILFHLRHGKVVGKTEGYYDGYGRVFGDTFRDYDPENPNSHQEIIKSEFELEDSGVASGIEAWHKVCYDAAPEDEKAVRKVSKPDPLQGRRRFAAGTYVDLRWQQPCSIHGQGCSFCKKVL